MRVAALALAVMSLGAGSTIAQPLQSLPAQPSNLPQVRVDRLPVYRLAPPQANMARAGAIFADAFKQSAVPRPNAGAPFAAVLAQGKMSIEVDRRSGYYFMADENFFLNFDARPQAPDERTARSVADSFVQRNQLLASGGDVRVAFEGLSVSGARAGGQEILFDRHVNYSTTVTANGVSLPVVGGGGQQKVVVGHKGRIVAYAGGWRPITGVAETVPIIPEKTAFAQYLLASGAPKISNVKMYLAYYAAPSFERQDFLMPVWVLSGRIETAAGPKPLRIQILPATKYGPRFGVIKPLLNKRPVKPAIELQKGDEYSALKPRGLMDALLPPAHAQSRVEADYDCASWWITSGLPRVYANRQGFFDGCDSIGFRKSFDWGDVNAWETDWTLYDDNEGADTADVVFYTGHADYSGWVLSPPADGGATYREVGADAATGADDRYGKFDAEHIIIAACGPHQSRSFTTGVDYADVRWAPIFNGLHTFSGYGAVTFDTSDEGRRFFEHIRSGRSVMQAWLRTGMDTQGASNGEAAPDGPSIYVTTMWPRNTSPTGSPCIGSETLRAGAAPCSDIPSRSVSVMFAYVGT